ncbi:hypothetical protein JOD02_001073 [Caldicoprobacter guelmensis]|nr:hypothetical protein [Caldicoprobacter guelmensis]
MIELKKTRAHLEELRLSNAAIYLNALLEQAQREINMYV